MQEHEADELEEERENGERESGSSPADGDEDGREAHTGELGGANDTRPISQRKPWRNTPQKRDREETPRRTRKRSRVRYITRAGGRAVTLEKQVQVSTITVKRARPYGGQQLTEQKSRRQRTEQSTADGAWRQNRQRNDYDDG